MVSKKSKLKTYILTLKEFNSHGQEGTVIHSFKADSLGSLDSYINLWESGNEGLIPAGRYKVKHKLPARFWDAGGFCSEYSTFTCRDTGEDMKVWWETQGWGKLKG